MVYLPQVVFKHILSFKDPRYERVMNGDPFMATPTRVFFTRDEACDANKPALFRHHDETDLSPYVDVHFYIDEIGEYGSFFSPMQFIRRLEASMNPIIDSDDEADEADDVTKCSNKVAEMSLQCEACGPELILFANP